MRIGFKTEEPHCTLSVRSSLTEIGAKLNNTTFAKMTQKMFLYHHLFKGNAYVCVWLFFSALGKNHFSIC